MRRHITLPQGNISHLACEIYHSYQKGINLFGDPKRHYKVDWKDNHKYITFTTPDGHKCRDNKLFAEQLLRKNLEIYFALGGCESGLADQYKQYVNNSRPEHTYTVGDGLFNLFKSLLESIPYEERFTLPVENHQLDKMTVMILESMGIKVEPKALFHYSAYNQQEEEQVYGLWM